MEHIIPRVDSAENCMDQEGGIMSKLLMLIGLTFVLVLVVRLRGLLASLVYGGEALKRINRIH